MVLTFTDVELDYLREQRLGRLATVDAAGAPQNNPVGFRLEPDSGQIVIGGYATGKSRKYRNVTRNPYVSFVVDDLASVDLWRVRGVEVREVAEALADVDPPMPGWAGRYCASPLDGSEVGGSSRAARGWTAGATRSPWLRR
jgi:pyridoxamine 5'-phosphate oxidase family protein